MENRRNYYRVLHVQPDAPGEIIRSSYRTMMQRLRMHPDLGGDDKYAAVLNEAYQTLSNPTNRAAYDTTQLKREPAGTAGKTAGKTSCRQSLALHQCAFCRSRHGYGKKIPADAFCGNCQSPLLLTRQSQIEDSCRRSIMRVQNNHPLIFCTHWPQSEPCSGHTNDLSLNGLKFHTGTSPALGQIIKIDSRVLRAVARVTHSQRQAPGWVVGAQFISLCFEQSRGTFITDQA